MHKKDGFIGLLSLSALRRSFATSSLWVFCGRFIGLFKDALLVQFLGIGAAADAFFVAYRIPNNFRATFAEGSVPGAFVPIFAQQLLHGQFMRAKKFLALALLCFGAASLGVLAIVWLCAEKFVALSAAGLDQVRFAFTVSNLKVLILLLPLFSLASVAGSLLQAAHLFFLNVAGPAVFNMGCIAALLLALWAKVSVWWLCFGFVAAGLLKLLLRLAVLYWHNLALSVPDAQSLQDLKTAGRRFLPIASWASFALINASCETLLASFLPMGQVSLFHYVFGLFNLIFYSIASPLEQLLLPQLSRLQANAQRLNFYFQEGIKLVLFLCLPTAIFVLLSATQICWIQLGHNSTAAQVWLAGQGLQILAIGITFQVLQRFLRKFFFALHDTGTPSWLWGLSVVFADALNLSVVIFWRAEMRSVLAGIVLSWILLNIGNFVMLQRKFQLIAKGAKIFKFAVHLSLCCVPGIVLVLVTLPLLAQLPTIAGGLLLNKILHLLEIAALWAAFLSMTYALRRKTLVRAARCYLVD